MSPRGEGILVWRKGEGGGAGEGYGCWWGLRCTVPPPSALSAAPGAALTSLLSRSRLSSGKLQDLGVVEGSKLTLVPTVEAGLMVSAPISPPISPPRVPIRAKHPVQFMPAAPNAATRQCFPMAAFSGLCRNSGSDTVSAQPPPPSLHL